VRSSILELVREVVVYVAVACGCGRFGFDRTLDMSNGRSDANGDASNSSDAPADAGGDLGDGPPGTPLTVIDPLTESPDTVALTNVGTLSSSLPAASVVGGTRYIGVTVMTADFDTSVEVDTGINRIIYKQGSIVATFVVRYGATAPLNVALPVTAALRLDVATADGAAIPCPVAVTIIDMAGRTGTSMGTIVAASSLVDFPAADPAFTTVDLERIAEIRFEFAPELQGADLQLRPITVVP
jgi:hypothetical protein